MVGFRITHLEIEGFQGANTRLSIPFGQQSTLLVGRNGSGKTTILRAVEFALYGSVAEMQGSDFTARREEVSNCFHPIQEAWVRLSLSNDSGESLVVTRTKSASKKKTTIVSMVHNGVEVTQNQQQTIESIVGLSQVEYHLLSYLSQAKYQELLTLKPTEKSEAFDSLLNTKQLSDLSNSLTDLIKHYRKNMDDGRLTKARKELGTLKDKITEIDSELSEAQLSLGQLFPDILDPSVTFVHQRLTTLAPSLTIAGQTAGELIMETKRVRADIERQHGQSSPEQLQNLLQQLSLLQNHAEESSSQLEQLYKLFGQQSVLDAAGHLSSLLERKSSLEKQIAQVKLEQSNQNQFIDFLRRARSLLDSHPSVTCPLCESDTFDSAQTRIDLLNRINDLEEQGGGDLQFRLDELQGELQKVEEQVEKHQDLQKQVSRSYALFKTQFEGLKTDLLATESVQSLHSSLKDHSIPVAPSEVGVSSLSQLVTLILKTLLAERERLQSQRNTRDSHLDLLLELSRLEEILGHLSTIESLATQSHQLTGQKTALLQTIRQLEHRERSLQQVVDSLGQTQEIMVAAQQEFVSKQLDTVNPSVEAIFQVLSPHPFWNELVITQKEAQRTGTTKNQYHFETRNPSAGGQSVNIRGYFSQGQANSSVLALVMGIATGTVKPLNYLMVDDITQSLDGEATKNLAKVMRNLSEKIQVVVASSDERFVRALRKELLTDPSKTTEVVLGQWGVGGIQLISQPS